MQNVADWIKRAYMIHGVNKSRCLQCVRCGVILVAGSCRHWMEVCQDEAVDELLWGRGHSAASLQHHPEPQVGLVPDAVAEETSVQKDEVQTAWNYRHSWSEFGVRSTGAMFSLKLVLDTFLLQKCPKLTINKLGHAGLAAARINRPKTSAVWQPKNEKLSFFKKLNCYYLCSQSCERSGPEPLC